MAGGAVLALLSSFTAWGQEPARTGTAVGPYPALPGATTKPPAWIGNVALFDVVKFFAAPPRDRNAAPLYLDALFEFDGGMESCFPEGPRRDRRRQDAEGRSRRYRELEDALAREPKAQPASRIDGVIAPYDAGFRRLAEAQRRERCVFEASIGPAPPSPHLPAARQVTRVAQWRVRRAVERGDLDGAIRDVETVLRLARDLQPRGAAEAQMLATAMVQVVGADMVPTILSSTKIRPAHCDRLLRAFLAQEPRAGDGYAEGLRAEYLAVRITLRDLVQDQAELVRKLGLKPGESVVKAIAGPSFASAPSGASGSLPDDADARVARTTPAELSRHERAITDYYRVLLDLDSVPYAGRIARIIALRPPGGGDLLSRAVPPFRTKEYEAITRKQLHLPSGWEVRESYERPTPEEHAGSRP